MVPWSTSITLSGKDLKTPLRTPKHQQRTNLWTPHSRLPNKSRAPRNHVRPLRQNLNNRLSRRPAEDEGIYANLNRVDRVGRGFPPPWKKDLGTEKGRWESFVTSRKTEKRAKGCFSHITLHLTSNSTICQLLIFLFSNFFLKPFNNAFVPFQVWTGRGLVMKCWKACWLRYSNFTPFQFQRATVPDPHAPPKHR